MSVPINAGNNPFYPGSTASDPPVTTPTTTVEYGQVSDTKAPGSSGGASVAGSWQVRDINAIDVVPTSGWLSVPGGNIFVINGTAAPGKYRFEWGCMFYKGERVATRIWNVTAAAPLKIGRLNGPRAVGNDCFEVRGDGALDITSTQTFRLEYLCQTADALGLGLSATAAPLNAEDAVFATVKITKYASL